MEDDNFLIANNETQIYTATLSSQKTKPKSAISRQYSPVLQLLSWEINFINSKVEADGLIVYIGETIPIKIGDINHGSNIVILAKLYPFLSFYVFDEENYSSYYDQELFDMQNVRVFQRMPFEEEYNNFSSNKNTYLICNLVEDSVRIEPIYVSSDKTTDIISKTKEIANEKKIFFEKKEESNIISLERSKELIKRLSPKSTLVKFRPNHSSKFSTFNFFNGIILLPIFSSEKSAECRMIIDEENLETEQVFNFELIFENLNYWNQIMREKEALNPFTKTSEPMGNYQNNMEFCVLFSILKDYYTSIGHIFSTYEDVNNLFKEIIEKKI